MIALQWQERYNDDIHNVPIRQLNTFLYIWANILHIKRHLSDIINCIEVLVGLLWIHSVCDCNQNLDCAKTAQTSAKAKKLKQNYKSDPGFPD